jgi:hypothetical protein
LFGKLTEFPGTATLCCKTDSSFSASSQPPSCA